MKIYKLLPVVLLSLLATGPTCSNSEVTDYCTQKCECEMCSDKIRNECLVNEQAEYDYAKAYECDEEFDELYTCLADRYTCDEGDYTIDYSDYNECSDQAETYSTCVTDASGYYDD